MPAHQVLAMLSFTNKERHFVEMIESELGYSNVPLCATSLENSDSDVLLSGSQHSYNQEKQNQTKLPDNKEIESLGGDPFYDLLDPDMTYWVNKERSLSKFFAPKDLVVIAKEHTIYGRFIEIRQPILQPLLNLFSYAKSQNIELRALSGYRSFDVQAATFQHWVNYWDSEALAEKESAWPGHSEHQLGITLDLTSLTLGDNPWFKFGQSVEGQWLKANAHKFGFTISYQEMTEALTGYIWEPWHIRYVGRPLATYLYQRQQVIEQYFQAQSAAPVRQVWTEDKAFECAQYSVSEKSYWTCSTQQKLNRCDASGALLTYQCQDGCYVCESGSHSFCADNSNPSIALYAKERNCSLTTL
ncbi:MAG: M15 family metallopeptidase [Oligoflexales bacterium]|nr:M15 family metallopeptidase [Oligoflexales bacterium]